MTSIVLRNCNQVWNHSTVISFDVYYDLICVLETCYYPLVQKLNKTVDLICSWDVFNSNDIVKSERVLLTVCNFRTIPIFPIYGNDGIWNEILRLSTVFNYFQRLNGKIFSVMIMLFTMLVNDTFEHFWSVEMIQIFLCTLR